jgi:hypothetical protein
MSGAEKEVLSLLNTARAILVRTNGHRVYRLPSAGNWVTPSTPSDIRSWKNKLSALKRKLRTHTEKTTEAAL